MIHSFLLIGQSNMAGRGNISEAKNVDTSHIKIFRNGRWCNMFRPINADCDRSGVCLGESFAEAYSKKYNVDVGLICCAVGGTTLEEWSPGGSLYDNAISQTKLAMRNSTLVGILWHQGESDCSIDKYPTYAERIKRFIQAVREDVGLENIPFIVGGLGDYLKDCIDDKDVKNYIHINGALKEVANSDEMIEYVSATGLTSNADKLHFDAKSLHEFGIRYFNQFEKLRKINYE